MKKIIKLSLILFGTCVITGKANAQQLASDQPTQTVKVIQVQKAKPVAKVTEVQTASSMPTVKPITTRLNQAVVEEKVTANDQAKILVSAQGAETIKVTPVTITTEAKLPTVSMQGTPPAKPKAN